MSRIQRKLARPSGFPRLFASPLFGSPAILVLKVLFLAFATGISWMMAPPANAWAHPGQFQNHGVGSGGFHSGHFRGGSARPGHFHHRGGHAAIIIAAPLLGYYPPPYYTGPIAVDGAPVTFIEQASDGNTSSYWYYCANPPGYYPQVQACPSGWQAVGATPPY